MQGRQAPAQAGHQAAGSEVPGQGLGAVLGNDQVRAGQETGAQMAPQVGARGGRGTMRRQPAPSLHP